MRPLVSLWLFLALAAPAFARTGQSAASRAAPPRPAAAVPLAPLPIPRGTAVPPAVADPASWCETAVTTAEDVNRLPPRLLGAISLTETGRIEARTGRVRPWPWTINAEGEGQFFETRQQAITAVKALQARGVRSIDVGCLQVNLMHHPDAFASLKAAFDPRRNANYAARFLNALYAGSKDWTSAIAAYHSETPALGQAYRVLVMARWRNGDPHAAVPRQVAYGDFAQEDKAYDDQAYGAFAPDARIYGAFAPH